MAAKSNGTKKANGTGKKMGRKRVEIDMKQFEQLAAIHCTQEEIAGVFGVNRETIKNRLKEPEYREAYENGLARGKASLRRTQFDLAKKNAGMAIFLGKQYLDQRDVTTNEHSGPNGKPIQYEEVNARELISERITGIRAKLGDDEIPERLN